MTRSQGFLLLYMMPVIWSLSGHTLRWAGYSGEIRQSMVFMFYTSVVSTIVGLPWSLYGTFAVEQRHGFNKQVGGVASGRRCEPGDCCGDDWGLGWG